mmetsp:Transcript_81284/g.161629  ORF Transcript_81284/g.161629 Transcript_81284/m.161629 type:complete len:266 (+) Transcript_81284:1697-2494(+)
MRPQPLRPHHLCLVILLFFNLGLVSFVGRGGPPPLSRVPEAFVIVLFLLLLLLGRETLGFWEEVRQALKLLVAREASVLGRKATRGEIVLIGIGQLDAFNATRKLDAILDCKQHLLISQVGVEVHFVELIVARDFLVALCARTRCQFDAARCAECVLYLDQSLGAIREQVGDLAREDAHYTEQQVTRHTQRHRNRLDILDGLGNVGLNDGQLRHLLLHVGGQPDLSQRALLGKHELGVKHRCWCQARLTERCPGVARATDSVGCR